MTALARLGRVRTLLTVAALINGSLWGATAAVVGIISGSPPFFAVLFGLVVLVTALWLNRAVLSRQEVALWLEGRVPALRYSLITLAEGVSGIASGGLEQKIAETSWVIPVRERLVRTFVLPAVLLALALVGLVLLPPWSRLNGSADTGTPDRSAPRSTSPADPFRSFMVTVTPPSYSRQQRQRLERPEAVTGLVGSAIRVDGDGWTAATTMPDTAIPFWLDQDGGRRLLVLLPILDSVPDIELVVPARDSVLASGSGTIALSSDARDDIGLESAWFEYIVSSGEGENYTFRSGVIGRRSLSNAPRGQIVSRLSLDSLRLAPGNIVHLRAVAQDGNTVSGPGIGYSETRTLRIPRPGEGDSVSVERVARAEGDSSLLSQRMLVMMAEALERRRPRLRRDTLVSESRRIAGEQAALRRRVADIIFLRLGAEGSMEESEDSTAVPLTPEALLEAAEQATVASGGEVLDFTSDETPVVALNRPLLEAYNAMWAAGRELEIGEPRRALPHMREALEAIQRARQAERIYLRGRPPAAVIDLTKVRLAGNLADAIPAPTIAPGRDQRTRDALLARYSRALALLPDLAVADSLQLLRIDALQHEPRFAAALGEAVAALRRGADATASLIQARRLLAGPIESAPGLAPWGMAP